VAKLVSAKCPHCGAPVQIPKDAEHVTCQYCAHSAFIQRDPKTVAPPSQPVIFVPPRTGVPVAPILFAVGLSVMGLGTTVAFLVYGAAETAKEGIGAALNSAVSSVAATTQRIYFSDQPLPFDVNGDGTLDIVGLSKTPGGAAWLAGYDGRDGKELWRSALLEKSQESSPALHGLVQGYVIVIDQLGKIQAYRATNGQPAWAGLLGERAQRLCQGDGFVRITATDRSVHELDLATGTKRPGESKEPCQSVPASSGDDGAGFRIIGWSDFDEYGLPSLHSQSDMAAHRALVVGDQKLAFLLGSKASGSSVAMIAAVENGKVLWKSLVPAVDPLTTKVNVTTQTAAYAAGKVVVPYSLSGSEGVRMAAFEAESGKRLWDVPIHDKSQVSSGIQMSDRDVYYASWTALYVLDAATGKLRFRVGTEF
jgi:outer membrane protein assembly factor BamB/DNA-directed RNA polymerase subunit RPC12/RpoP